MGLAINSLFSPMERDTIFLYEEYQYNRFNILFFAVHSHRYL